MIASTIPDLIRIRQQVMALNAAYGGKLNVKEWISGDHKRILKCVLTWAVNEPEEKLKPAVK